MYKLLRDYSCIPMVYELFVIMYCKLSLAKVMNIYMTLFNYQLLTT